MGHVMRMEDDTMPQAILRRTIDGQRRKGIPRRRWQQDVEDDWNVRDLSLIHIFCASLLPRVHVSLAYRDSGAATVL